MTVTDTPANNNNNNDDDDSYHDKNEFRDVAFSIQWRSFQCESCGVDTRLFAVGMPAYYGETANTTEWQITSGYTENAVATIDVTKDEETVSRQQQDNSMILCPECFVQFQNIALFQDKFKKVRLPRRR